MMTYFNIKALLTIDTNYSYHIKAIYMVQLMAKTTLAYSIQACVIQFYLSDLSQLACHMRVRLLLLHSSRSQVLHTS